MLYVVRAGQDHPHVFVQEGPSSFNSIFLRSFDFDKDDLCYFVSSTSLISQEKLLYINTYSSFTAIKQNVWREGHV